LITRDWEKRGEVSQEMQIYSNIGGISPGVLLHSRMTIVNNNASFISKCLKEDFECSHNEIMNI
jgi:hypothetical protein